jgi:hypothetical protein
MESNYIANGDEEIVRCPYCVSGDEFRPMLRQPEGWFVCKACGHMEMPRMSDFKCHCRKCREMHRAA